MRSISVAPTSPTSSLRRSPVERRPRLARSLWFLRESVSMIDLHTILTTRAVDSFVNLQNRAKGSKTRGPWCAEQLRVAPLRKLRVVIFPHLFETDSTHGAEAAQRAPKRFRRSSSLRKVIRCPGSSAEPCSSRHVLPSFLASSSQPHASAGSHKCACYTSAALLLPFERISNGLSPLEPLGRQVFSLLLPARFARSLT